jgi:hypothetical protein
VGLRNDGTAVGRSVGLVPVTLLVGAIVGNFEEGSDFKNRYFSKPLPELQLAEVEMRVPLV